MRLTSRTHTANAVAPRVRVGFEPRVPPLPEAISGTMEPTPAPGDLRRRRRTLPRAVTLPGSAPVAPFHPANPPERSTGTFGYAQTQLPPGSRKLDPVEPGEQGISNTERPHAEQAMKRLFEAKGVDMFAFYDRESKTYELRSRTGLVRWERWATPDGEIRYVVVAQSGENPIPDVDGTILRTIEEETAAAGGSAKFVPKERNSYPDMLGRIAQLFDNDRAPEFVYIPTPGGDPNHPGAGSHGIPDMVQSRSPLVIAGPGVAQGVVAEALVRHEDIAPTIAEMLGVRPIVGTNATGVRRSQLLKWQDGRSLVSGIADARTGASPHGAASRAVVFTIDGMSQTALLDEIKKGTLPNMARIMARGTMFRNGSLAEYPTVTWANHNTIVTGASPGHNGLVNNSWWDRTTQKEQLITDGGFKNVLRTGKLMEQQVETLYEAVERSFPGAKTFAINQPSGRGADVSILDLVGLTKLLPSIAQLGVKWLGNRALRDKEMEGSAKEWKGEAIKDAFATAVGQVFWGKDDPPKLGVFEYTLVDNRGHLVGPHTEDARRALRAVDAQVGKVLDAIDKRGITGSTAIVLTADHGMGHQDTDVSKLGGWFQALDRAAADGARTKESTRFVYVRSVDWKVDGAVPALGTTGDLSISVVNDDADASGAKPAIAGATVTVTDGSGGQWVGVTDSDGRVKVQVAPKSGPLRVKVQHVDYSNEQGTVPVPGAAPVSSGASARMRTRRRP
ncbi:MAG: type phosphodiesterase/nucleotide pyrophosphatase [Thermoleophilia bacterium]|nr:type phosphodiesterase/nucleotide pyrophosphatase [Thermoleophilia bacterium]